jgi:hypothetical protein
VLYLSRGIVGGAIVDHDDLDPIERIGLLTKRGEALRQVGRAERGEDDNRHLRQVQR